MRAIHRTELQAEIVDALGKLQAESGRLQAADNFSAADHWKGHRKTPSILAVFAALQQMAGARQRCMYCVDSLGSDIEHFRPKTAHPGRMYTWDNLLLACADCGRKKGTQFPLDKAGEPLLIDPSVEDPWEFLDFEPQTGNLTARYLLLSGAFSAKGETTVAVLHLDRRDGVAFGYLKTYRDLCRLVVDWTDAQLTDDYLERLREADDHGLLGWFLHGAGENELAFSRFRERYPDAWLACQQSFR